MARIQDNKQCYIRNKSRSCTVGKPAGAGKDTHPLELGGELLAWGPGDVVHFPHDSIWRVISMVAADHWVACGDPREMDELGVPPNARDPSGKRFRGLHFVLENATQEIESEAVGQHQRIAHSRRLHELESSALEGETAKAENVQLKGVVDAQRDELEKVRKELDAMKAARKK